MHATSRYFRRVHSDRAHVRSLCEVLPAESKIWAVGGTGAANLKQWLTPALSVSVSTARYIAQELTPRKRSPLP
jgi:hypothetical protein